jgi:hypothetical protein
MTKADTLQEELRVFEQHKEEWFSSHLGDFVAVSGATVVGFYPDYESAFRAGLKAVGLGKDFLVKQITAEDPAYLIS